MELAYQKWQDPKVAADKREEVFENFRAISREFYKEEFHARLPTELNVNSLSYGVAHLVADMCIANPALRPSSAACIPRLRLLEQVEKALVGPLMPTKSTPLQSTARTCLGSATAANAFRIVERATAAETAALSANSFANFAVPLPVADAAPALAAAAAAVNVAATMNTPNIVQSMQMGPRCEPEAEPVPEYELLVDEIEPLGIQIETIAQQVEPPQPEQLDILAIAIAVVDPPSNATIPLIAKSRSQVTIGGEDSNTAAPISYMSPVSDNDRQRLKAIVQQVDEALAYSKKNPLAGFTTDEDLEIIRRLRKRGPNQILNPLGKELMNLVLANDAPYLARKRVFTLLTLRSVNFWKNGGPSQAIRKDNNNNNNNNNSSNDV